MVVEDRRSDRISLEGIFELDEHREFTQIIIRNGIAESLHAFLCSFLISCLHSAVQILAWSRAGRGGSRLTDEEDGRVRYHEKNQKWVSPTHPM